MAATKVITKAFIKSLEAERKKIAEARDKLRDLQDVIRCEMESFEQGLASLEESIDYFSQYV
jgi:hypothetical protein